MRDDETNAFTAEAATQEDALPQNKVTLIGIFGPEAEMQALVRMSGGRIRKIGSGSRLGATVVQAIAPDHLILGTGPNTRRLTFPSP